MKGNYVDLRKKYQDRFEEIRAQLNEDQRRAVDTIDGPVLTIAGPGTGKTHILAARIGQILTETDTRPFNILCLTYTDAGVYAMRRRLLEFIGPEAHRIHIFTFHSFCNKVIQENIELFGYNELMPASELEKIDLVRQIIDSQDADHPLRRDNSYNPYFYEKHLLQLFSRMKTEGWNISFINDHVQSYLRDLPNNPSFIYQRNGPTYKKGDLKQRDIDRECERMEQLLSAANLFEEYDFLMKSMGRYDYDDMILWVLNAFYDPEQELLLRRYQEQYLYVLVDEFQDTNGAQSKILNKLIEYWEQPNVFIVGDDDQSIFEFQGARLKNMLDFYQLYEEYLEVIVLRNNYRSGQLILDLSKNLIDHNDIRIIRQLSGKSLDKNLVASGDAQQAKKTAVHVIEYPNKLQEESDIIRQLQALKRKKVPLNEVAIIYARHRQASDLIRQLERNNLPYQTRRQLNILELPVIQNLRLLLGYISKELERPYSGEELVYEILHFDFLGVSAEDVSKLTSFLARDNQQKFARQEYDQILNWRDLIHSSEQLRRVGLKEPNRVLNLARFLDEMVHSAVNHSLPSLVEKVINRSGLIVHIAQSPQKNWLVEVVNSFFEFVRSESLRKPELDLKHLLLQFDRMEENRIELGVSKNSYAEDGVHLLTAHSAKGLEFEYVFLINCIEDYWESKSVKGLRIFKLPETLTHSDEESDSLEAARRLFYVAITRAKSFLQLSYFSQNSDQKVVKRTQFIDEFLEGMPIEVELRQVPHDYILKEQFSFLEEKELPNSAKLDTYTLNALLEGFRMSVSALNSYLECPRSFYFQYVLRLPSLASISAMYGTAIHNAIKRIFDQAEHSAKRRFPPITELLAAFEQELSYQRIYMSPQAYEDCLQMGQKHLPSYYKQRVKEWNNQLKIGTVWTEKPFKNLEYRGVPLTGVIDKVIIVSKPKKDQRVHVVDYKSGKHEGSRLTIPHTRNKTGGIYWRQLVFYKILVERSGLTNYKVHSGEIDYLSPDNEGDFPQKQLSISSEDVGIMGQLIEDTYKDIMAHRFSRGCNKRHCKWCNFVKKQTLPESFNDEGFEILDD